MKRTTVARMPAAPKLHQFIAYHIRRSGLTHREIAHACGFKRPNIVSMVKHGQTRLPLDRLGAIARALEIDAFDLYCRFMHEYYPDTWGELKELIPGAGPTMK